MTALLAVTTLLLGLGNFGGEGFVFRVRGWLLFEFAPRVLIVTILGLVGGPYFLFPSCPLSLTNPSRPLSF